MPLFSGLPSKMRDAATEIARRGVPVFPLQSNKKPFKKGEGKERGGFYDATTDLAQIDIWWGSRPFAVIGVRTGSESGLWLLDFDVTEGDPDDMLAEFEERFGPLRTLRVRTGRGGIHLYFKYTGRVAIAERESLWPGGPRCDWRGEGGYAVAPPSRTQYGPYVVEIDMDPVEAPAALIEAIVARQGVTKAKKETGSAPELQVVGGVHSIQYEHTVRELAEKLKNQGEWHKAQRTLIARLTAAYGIKPEDWIQLSPLFQQPGYSLEQTIREIQMSAEGAFRKFAPEQSNDAANEPLPISAYDHDVLSSIPAREWVYGSFLIKRYLTVLGAPGGVGKTALAITIALAVAAGRALIGQQVHKTGRVLVINLEDDLDEIRRRVGAAMILHGVKPSEIKDRLFVMSGRDQQLVIAERTKEGGLIATPNVERLLRELRERDITAVICDPFVKSHRLEENRNEQVDFAATLWTKIAHESGCATLLLHHFRKGGTSGEADAFRGASALIDAARSAISLAPMSEKERDAFNLDNEMARRLVRLDNAKANLAVKPDRAEWFELASVTLPNGDSVQAVRKWDPPALFKNISAELANKILDVIAGGAAPGILWSPIKRAGDRWAGQAVMNYAAREGQEITEEVAKRILDQWIKSGVLEEVEFQNKETRSKAKGFRVIDEKRPGREPGDGQ